jgi:hypothetical protein
MTLEDVRTKHRPKVWHELREAWPKGADAVWRITITKHSDQPRLLQPAGRKSGDYTTDPLRAMRGRLDAGEALTETQLEQLLARRQ